MEDFNFETYLWLAGRPFAIQIVAETLTIQAGGVVFGSFKMIAVRVHVAIQFQEVCLSKYYEIREMK